MRRETVVRQTTLLVVILALAPAGFHLIDATIADVHRGIQLVTEASVPTCLSNLRCEETGQWCRGPANHNSVALILPQKALLSCHGGAIWPKTP